MTQRQSDAGERLRADWERAQHHHGLGRRTGLQSSRRGADVDLNGSQIDAKRRFHAAIDAAGPRLSDILWRVVCSEEGMHDAETALGWLVRACNLVLTLALDRVADYYRID